MMEWSEMLPEVLDIIAQKYITRYEDYPNFAGVCKSWRLAAAARTYHNSNGPPSRFPSLMLNGKSDDHESRELFLHSNKSIRKIRLPEIYKACWHSSCGWLLSVQKDFTSQLINPLSHEIINLPKIDTFPEATRPLLWEYAISKVILLLEFKLVLVMWGIKKLGFCHIGDNKWTCVEPGLDNYSIHDITFYNGQVYTFHFNNTIRACDINGKDPKVLVDVAKIPEDVYNETEDLVYIVGLDDGERKRLLVIIRYGVLIFKEGSSYTKSFKVLAYDLETGNWSRMTDFGTKTLFVGRTSSFWVEDTTGVIKGNCIYYIDGDEGIYHMLEGNIEPQFTGESLSRVTGSIWLQSM